MQRFSQETGDSRVRDAMTAMLRAEASGNPMDVSTAAAPILLNELREDSPFWLHKQAAQTAFRLQDWHRALDSYIACKDQLQASPIQMQRPTDGGAAQKALGAELAKLNANISLLHLKLHQPERAVAAAATAVAVSVPAGSRPPVPSVGLPINTCGTPALAVGQPRPTVVPAGSVPAGCVPSTSGGVVAATALPVPAAVQPAAAAAEGAPAGAPQPAAPVLATR